MAFLAPAGCFWRAGPEKPEGDVPGSVSFTGTLHSGGGAAPGALAVVVVCKNLDHNHQKPPVLTVVCRFLDHYRQSAYFKMPRATY